MHSSGRKKEGAKRDLPILSRCLKCKRCLEKGIVERVKKARGGSNL